jgi:hypothetical protein
MNIVYYCANIPYRVTNFPRRHREETLKYGEISNRIMFHKKKVENEKKKSHFSKNMT